MLVADTAYNIPPSLLDSNLPASRDNNLAEPSSAAIPCSDVEFDLTRAFERVFISGEVGGSTLLSSRSRRCSLSTNQQEADAVEEEEEGDEVGNIDNGDGFAVTNADNSNNNTIERNNDNNCYNNIDKYTNSNNINNKDNSDRNTRSNSLNDTNYNRINNNKDNNSNNNCNDNRSRRRRMKVRVYLQFNDKIATSYFEELRCV